MDFTDGFAHRATTCCLQNEKLSSQNTIKVLLNNTELLYETLRCSHFKQQNAYDIYMNFWGFHDGDCLNSYVLGLDTVQTSERIETFQMNTLPPSPAVKGQKQVQLRSLIWNHFLNPEEGGSMFQYPSRKHHNVKAKKTRN